MFLCLFYLFFKTAASETPLAFIPPLERTKELITSALRDTRPIAGQILSSVISLGPDNSQSKITRDTQTAVNTFAHNPITSVTAKPLTGPVPNRNRNRHETMVVT